MLSKTLYTLVILSLSFVFSTFTKSDVIINGRNLSTKQVKALTAQYGVEPLPGEYWYDATSGLYGAVGHQAFGFMLPGHDLGDISRDASSGDTYVLVNGRELPYAEWLIWSYMLGNPIQPGAYWLDAEGNAGSIGSTHPQVNLFVLAQKQRLYWPGAVAETISGRPASAPETTITTTSADT